MSARERLAAVAAEHGHDAATLALICEATFPTHTAGTKITDEQLAQVADSIDVLATAGLKPSRLAQVIDQHKARRGPAWRESFWKEWCWIADRRTHQATTTWAPATTASNPAGRGDPGDRGRQARRAAVEERS